MGRIPTEPNQNPSKGPHVSDLRQAWAALGIITAIAAAIMHTAQHNTSATIWATTAMLWATLYYWEVNNNRNP